MTEEDHAPEKTYTVTVGFTDGAEPVTAIGCTAEELGRFYDVIGEDDAAFRMWTDSPRRLVMFRGKYVREIVAVEEPAE